MACVQCSTRGGPSHTRYPAHRSRGVHVSQHASLRHAVKDAAACLHGILASPEGFEVTLLPKLKLLCC